MQKNKPRIIFVATVEYAVNAFLLGHLKTLSPHFDIKVIVNCDDIYFLKKQGLNVDVICLRFHRKIHLFLDCLCLIQIIFIFLKIKPAAVHSITPKAGILAMLASRLTFVPVRVHTFTGQVWTNKNGFSKILLKFFDFLIAKLANFNFIDSHSQRDFLVKHKILPLERSIVFANGSVSGVDLGKFKADGNVRNQIRRRLQIPYGAFIYLYLGRLNHDKGVLDLASAFSKIKSKHAYLVVVGPDEAGISEQLKIFVGESRDKLRLVGFSNEPYRYLAASDVLCLPSYREGFGSVIIEAAAMGVPAIASDIYGVSDAVQNRKTGLLHPPGDIDAILKCMATFLTNPRTVKIYGLAAKKRAISKFDSNILCKHWLRFYLDHLH